MGQGEKAGRRALVDNVKDCIAQVNAMTALASEVREAHNKLAGQTRADLSKLDVRLDAQAAWLKKLEHAVDEMRVKVLLLRANELALDDASFWQRLRWLLTGQRPDASPYALEMSSESAGPAPKVTPIHESAVATEQFGRMSAGMAPRPLP